MKQKTLLQLAKKHGTPLFIVDHKELRANYARFRKHFPRVQIYYAIKVNSDPHIVETFYKLGGSFDVASMQEFHTVHQFIKKLQPRNGRPSSGTGSFTPIRSSLWRRCGNSIDTSHW